MTVAVVAIGRNEGARLHRCLTSLRGQVDRIVYVDSGSRDDSVRFARDQGVEVVLLDTRSPFTAARARNAGFAALRVGGLPDYVQFVDGDCAVAPGWISAAQAALDADPALGVVTGWRTEIAPDASVYNAMAEVEWHRPAGPITTCGGDMMVRAAVFDALGGFDPSVIAAEDDEFCLRVGQAGHGLIRLPVTMTRHDAAMTRFAQWWQRAVRAGHGFAQVGAMHPPHFRAEQRRVWLFGAVLPLLAIGGAVVSGWLLVAVLGLYAVSYVRTVRGLWREGLTLPKAMHHAAFYTLSKLPNLIGMLTYHTRQRRGAAMRIIEYK